MLVRSHIINDTACATAFWCLDATVLNNAGAVVGRPILFDRLHVLAEIFKRKFELQTGEGLVIVLLCIRVFDPIVADCSALRVTH